MKPKVRKKLSKVVVVKGSPEYCVETGKIRYKTRTRAKAATHQLSNVTIYFCRHCRNYHVSTSQKIRVRKEIIRNMKLENKGLTPEDPEQL